MNEILAVKNITKYYNNKRVLDNISFTLNANQTLGIVGKSGSGKSTLAKIIMNLESCDNGEVYIKNKLISKSSKSNKYQLYNEIQMVFQNPISSFNPRKTLGSSVIEILLNNGYNKQQAKEKVLLLFKKCHLDDSVYDKYPHQISGGQCQRVAIVRALLINPQIIICDEATSNLDATVQIEIIKLLQEIQKEFKTTLVFICHNIALVQLICDEIIVMEDGVIVEYGTTSQVIHSPKTSWTKALIDASI